MLRSELHSMQGLVRVACSTILPVFVLLCGSISSKRSVRLHYKNSSPSTWGYGVMRAICVRSFIRHEQGVDRVQLP